MKGSKSPKTQFRIVNPTDKVIYVTKRQTMTTAEKAQVLDAQMAEANQLQPASELPNHLQPFFAETCAREKLNNDARTRLRLLLERYHALFTTSSRYLGHTMLVKHDINMGDCLPIRQPV